MLNLDLRPLTGSEVASRWNALYDFLIGLSVFFTILVLGAMIYFAIVHRRRPGVRTKYITDHHLLELIWTVIPTVLLLGIFVWGYAIYSEMISAPADSMEIRVVGQQWKWNFQYADGRILSNKFYVPVNRPVKMVLTSQDVLHGFSMPTFRVKSDVVPGMYTSVWFESKVPGRHQVYCTAYCGADHSLMLADAYVLTAEQWEAFLKGRDPGPIPDAGKRLASADQVHFTQAASVSLVDQGKALAAAKACTTCHAVDRESESKIGGTGPSWLGLYGSMVELTNGESVKADDNFIRESIENPAAKVRNGFQPGQMPPYLGQVSESDLAALIAYIRSLK